MSLITNNLQKQPVQSSALCNDPQQKAADTKSAIAQTTQTPDEEYISDTHDISAEKKALNKINIDKATPESLVVDIYNAIFKSNNNINTTIGQYDCVNWKIKDDISFGFDGWRILTVRPSLSTINDDVDILKDFFVNNGFSKSKNNTNSNLKGMDGLSIPGETFGFEKDDFKCSFGWSEATSDPNPKNLKKDYFNLSCAKYTSQDQETFQTFLGVFGTGTTKYFCVKKQDGNFSKGLMSWAAWYGKKIHGDWKIIWSGQDIPPCSEVTDFPHDIVDSCYDKEDGGEKVFSDDKSDPIIYKERTSIYTNNVHGFEFKYPQGLSVAKGSTDDVLGLSDNSSDPWIIKVTVSENTDDLSLEQAFGEELDRYQKSAPKSVIINTDTRINGKPAKKFSIVNSHDDRNAAVVFINGKNVITIYGNDSTMFLRTILETVLYSFKSI